MIMRAFLTLAICFFLALPTMAAEPSADGASRRNLTIVMDENLILHSAMLARAYANLSNTPLTLVVKNPDTENEIRQGLEAHLLLTADQELIDHLAAQGLTDVSSTRTIGQTALALVTPSDSAMHELFANHISFAAMIYATPNTPIYIEPARTEAGSRSTMLMHGYEFSSQLSARTTIMPSRPEMLDALRTHKGLALMLASDAELEHNLTILSILPDTLSTPVRYKMLILASEAMNEARAFSQFLESKEAQEILKKARLYTAKN
jgi:ABC-type molybdate transport system substrate-binding protein